MAQLTLDERFRNDPPTRGGDDYHRWMTADERRFVLWGIKEEWSAAKIARALGVNEATVRRFRQKFAKDPDVLLKLGLFEMVGRARDEEYRCLVCGEQLIGKTDTERHVLAHFIDPRSRDRKGRDAVDAATLAPTSPTPASTQAPAESAETPAPDLPDLEESVRGTSRRLYNRLQQPAVELVSEEQATIAADAESTGQLPLMADPTQADDGPDAEVGPASAEGVADATAEDGTQPAAGDAQRSQASSELEMPRPDTDTTRFSTVEGFEETGAPGACVRDITVAVQPNSPRTV